MAYNPNDFAWLPDPNANLDQAAGYVKDAGSHMQELEDLLTSGQIDYKTYQSLYSQFAPQAVSYAGNLTTQGQAQGEAINPYYIPLSQNADLGGADLKTFMGIFKNLTGKDPTGEDIQSYFSNVGDQLKGITGGTRNTSDVHSVINQYLSDQYQPQIQGYQKQQQTDALTSAQGTVQDMIKKQNALDIADLTSPDSMQKLQAKFNQNGLLDSGAFSQGLGDELAHAAASNESNAIAGVTIPGVNNMQNTANAPYQQYLNGLPGGTQQVGQNQQDMTNFGIQNDFAKSIEGMMSPSGASQYGPEIQGFEQAIGLYAQKTSYVCEELIRRGLAIGSDLDLLHLKIMPAMFTKGRAFWCYAIDAQKLVDAANRVGIDWSLWRRRFLDNVIHEKDAESAVNVYALACRDLAMECDPSLWDERVLRTGFWDSLPFIPKLFTYKPFIEALIKVAGMKMHFIIDIPLSQVR